MWYRFYAIVSGHIVRAEDYQCSDDAVALIVAEGILRKEQEKGVDDVEFWQGARRGGSVCTAVVGLALTIAQIGDLMAA